MRLLLVWDCVLPPSSWDDQGNVINGGSCVQKYYIDAGVAYVTVNGHVFESVYDGNPYTQPATIAADLASKINSYFGGTIATASGYGFGQVDISGPYTLSDLHAEETDPDWTAYAGATWMVITTTHP